MEKILLLLGVDAEGKLSKAGLEAVEQARRLACSLDGASWTIGLVGRDVGAAARQVAATGAGKLLAVAGDAFAHPRYASDADAAAALARRSEATLILAPADSRWMRALPGAAHRLGAAVDTHIAGIEAADGAVRVRRWYYRQRIEAAQTRQSRPWVLLVDAGNVEPWSGEAAEAAVEEVPVEASEAWNRTTVVGTKAPEIDQQTIRPDADLLFVAGAGWTKKQADGRIHVEEAAELILDFVRKTKCSLGSSKSLVDLSSEGQAVLPFLTHLHQVGQTGSTPRHPKGLATCCHGEEPHVVGWRFIKERRAVNLDPNCGWAQGKADVLYVADAFAVMREVNRLLG